MEVGEQGYLPALCWQSGPTHLCLCLSSMYSSLWYSLAVVQVTVWSTVRRAPRRMVPPCREIHTSGAGI
jgi:hypothetical protein